VFSFGGDFSHFSPENKILKNDFNTCQRIFCEKLDLIYQIEKYFGQILGQSFIVDQWKNKPK
jgi:hypothetical protein